MGGSQMSSPTGAFESPRASSSALIFRATSCGRPASGTIAPRKPVMPARERSPSQGQ